MSIVGSHICHCPKCGRPEAVHEWWGGNDFDEGTNRVSCATCGVVLDEHSFLDLCADKTKSYCDDDGCTSQWDHRHLDCGSAASREAIIARMKKRVQDAMEKQARQWELSGLDRMLLTELERSEYAQSVELYEKNVHEDPMSDSVWESLAHFTCELMWKRGLDPNEWMVAEDGRTIRQKTKRDKRQWSLSEDEREELARLLFNRDSKDRIDFAEEMARFEAQVLEEHGFDPWEMSVTEDGIGCRTDLPKNS